MAYYTGTASGPDRTKAIIAVLGVHALLATVILTGLNVQMIGEAVERMQTFDIRQTPPPPPQRPPPPARKPQKAKLEAGVPGKKANPTPIVAPEPKLPLPSPIPAAKIAGTGNATTSGAANYGTGTGAGGAGNGPGGGGYGGYTPARRISKIPDREYRRLADTGLVNGSVGVTIKVNTDGSVSNCRIARSSGNGYADALMCQLTVRYVRFDPARDGSGRAVAQDVTFYPNWWRP